MYLYIYVFVFVIKNHFLLTYFIRPRFRGPIFTWPVDHVHYPDGLQDLLDVTLLCDDSDMTRDPKWKSGIVWPLAIFPNVNQSDISNHLHPMFNLSNVNSPNIPPTFDASTSFHLVKDRLAINRCVGMINPSNLFTAKAQAEASCTEYFASGTFNQQPPVYIKVWNNTQTCTIWITQIV